MRHTVFKKFTSLILALLMFLPTVPVAFAASPSDFIDFPTGWSNEAVTAAVNNGLLNGRSANTIEPEGNLTRAEMATIINRAFGATIEKDISAYADVSPNEWYYHEIAKAVNMQTFQGDASGTMRPNDSITREEVFAVIARALVLETSDYSSLNKFNDAYAVSEWAKPYASILVAKGYVNGDTLGNLNPLSNITREEFAQIMHNIVKTYHITAGEHTYAGPASTLIRVGGVTLSNVTVEGDLILGDGVGRGNVNLVNVTIKGRLLTRGGEGKVTLTNTTVAGGVVVKDVNGIVNFNNYRTEAPFIGIREITKATFIGETTSQGGATGGSTGGGGGGGGTGGGVPPAPTAKTITITYNANGGAVYPSSVTIAENGKIPNLPTPTKTGHTFAGWYKNSSFTGDRVTTSTTFSTATTLYAKWTVNKYDVTIDAPNGNDKEIEYEYGETLGSKVNFLNLIPDGKSLEDYKFYYIDGTTEKVVNSDSSVEKDLTIYYKEAFAVTFNFGYDGEDPQVKKVFDGEKVGNNYFEPTRNGYDFTGWFTSGSQKLTADTVITAPVSVTASWTAKDYNITYVSEVNFKEARNDKYNMDADFTLPVESDFEAHPGKTFYGWYLTDSPDDINRIYTIESGTRYGDITLYAKWVSGSDTTKAFVTFDLNYAGEPVIDPIPVTKGSKLTEKTLTDAYTVYRTSEGYKISGWYTDAACTAPYNFENPVNTNITLYAKWEPIKYTLTYHLVEAGAEFVGVPSSAEFTVEELPKYLYDAAKVSLYGKTLKKWHLSSVNGEEITAVPQGTTRNIDVYAEWEWNKYTVTAKIINNDGVTYTDNKVENVVHDSTLSQVFPEKFERRGYTYDEYSVNSDGSGDKYIDSSKVVSNLVLYPIWKKINYSVTLVADIKNDKVIFSDGEKELNIPFTIDVEKTPLILSDSVSFKNTDAYNFDGWYSVYSDGSFIGKLEKIENISANGNTYYAKWDIKTFDVTFVKDGVEEIVTYSYGDKLNKTAGKAGYKKAEWNTKSDGSGDTYTADSTVTQELKLYLYYSEPINYSVVYTDENSSFSFKQGLTVSYEYNVETEDIILPSGEDVVPADNTQKFIGWYSDATLQTPVSKILKGTTGNITLYPKFDLKEKHIVNFWYNHQTNSELYKQVSVVDGFTVNKPENDPEITGADFVDWYADSAGNTEFDFSKPITAETNIYAKWSAKVYTVKYNDGTVNSDASIIHGQKLNDVITDPTKTGYTFEGWNTIANSDTVTIAKDKVVDGEITDTLYPVWKAITYSISLDHNPESIPGVSVKDSSLIKEEFIITDLPYNLPGENAYNVPEGYKIDGWYETYSGDVYTNPAANVASISQDGKTYYAKWVKKTYDVKVYSDGTMVDVSFVHGDKISSKLDAPAPSVGYEFDGWSVNSDGTGKLYKSDDAVTGNFESDVIYPKFSPKTYYLTYEFSSEHILKSGYEKRVAFNVTQNVTLHTADAFVYNENYRFDHWLVNGEKVTVLEAGKYTGDVTATAVWTNVYKVTYQHKANGYKDVVEYVAEKEQAPDLPVSDRVSEGYKFAGWYYNGKKFDFETPITQNIILTAKWEVMVYTVTFNVDGDTTSVGYSHDDKISVNKPNPEKQGYEFLYWLASDETTKYYSDSHVKSNLTLKAVWSEPVEYTITYNTNGGEFNSGVSSSQKYKVTSDITIYSDGVFKDDETKVFKGWLIEGTTTVITSFDDIKKSNSYCEDIVLVAQWEAALQVHFDTNGGTPSVASQWIESGKTAVKPDTIPEREGYTFEYWELNGVEYKFTEAVTATVTLKAKWRAHTYTVKFNLNGAQGIETPEDMDFVYDVSQKLPVVSITGYEFTGWSVSSDGSGTTYEKDTDVKNITSKDEDTVTLYAQWSENEYTINFNANTGSGTTAQQKFKYTQVPERLSLNEFSKTGYNFVGWATAADAESVAYSDGSSAKAVLDYIINSTNEKSVTLYAIWSPVTYKIVYHGKLDTDSFTVTGSMDNSEFAYDADNVFEQSGFTRSGYKLKAWKYNETTSYIPGTVYSKLNLSSVQDAEVNVYAVWEPISYRVTYHPGVNTTEVKVSGTTEDSVHTFDEEKDLTTNEFERTGYTFKGWTTTPPAGMVTVMSAFSLTAQAEDEVVFSDAEGVTNLAEKDGDVVTLYAVWEANKYRVTYDRNGMDLLGGFPEGYTNAVYDEQVNIAPSNTFSFYGYVFQHWNTKSDGSGESYEAGKPAINITAVPDETVVLYAIAKEKVYTYKLHYKDDRDNYYTKENVKYTDVFTFPDVNGYTKTGYTFLGWSLIPTNNIPDYVPGGTEQYHFANDESVIDYYGVWAPNDYKVSFGVNGGLALTNAEIPSDASYSLENGKWVLTVTYDDVYPTLPTPKWVDETKYFAYWINKADGTKIVAGQTVKITDAIELEAVWTDEIRHTVVYRDYYTNGDAYSEETVNGRNIERPDDPPARVGYTFGGWFSDVYCTNPFDFTSKTAEGEAKTFTAYPKWIAHKYEIIFDGNGATGGSMGNQGFKYGSEQKLYANSYVKPGYIFDGWTANSDGSGTYYKNEEVILNLTSDEGAKITLYAKWKASPYTVVFSGNGAKGTMESLTFNYTDDVSLPANSYTYQGYNFAGWSTNKNAQLPSYSDNASKSEFINELLISSDGSITLYAIWNVNTYNIAFNANNGTGSMNSMENLAYTASVALTKNAFVRNGYNFTGWNIASDGSGISYNDEEIVEGITAKNGGTVILYAQWEIIEYNITYSGAQFKDATKVPYTYTVEDEVILPGADNMLVSPAGNFLYWLDENLVRIDRITKGTTGNKTLTAKRGVDEARLFTVTLVVDGVSTSNSVPQDTTISSGVIGYTEPTKSGYEFVEWNTLSDGSGIAYDAEKTPITQSVTLYAIWEELPAESYTITYNIGDGKWIDETSITKSYTANDEVTLPTASDFAERTDGKVFAGWYLDEECTSDAGTTIPKGSTGDKVFWAKWDSSIIVTFYDGAVEDEWMVIDSVKAASGKSLNQSVIDSVIAKSTFGPEKGYIDNGETHYIYPELWYITSSGEWEIFDDSVVVNSDMNVYYAFKKMSFFFNNIQVGEFKLTDQISFVVPYRTDTRLMDSIKDGLTIARGSISAALKIDDIYVQAIEKAAEKASEKSVDIVDSEGNIKYAKIDTPISNIIKASEISGEIGKYIETLVVDNTDDAKLASVIAMAKGSELIVDICGNEYSYEAVKKYISGLSAEEKEDFAAEIHEYISLSQTYADFINVFKDEKETIAVTSENVNLVMAVASAVNEYSYDELKGRINDKFGKVIDVLGDEIVEEFMRDAQNRYYTDAEIIWEDITKGTINNTTYPSYLTFQVNVVDQLFKPLYEKYSEKVIAKFTEDNIYYYADNPHIQELAEMSADTIVSDLLYPVDKTEENIGYALWPSSSEESGFMHYYDYFLEKLIILDKAMLWYSENLSAEDFEAFKQKAYGDAAKALNKANEMLAAYEKDGSLPMGKNISDLMEIEAFAKIFNKVEDKLVKALEKFKTTEFYGKEWTADSVRYDIPYGDLAGDVALGTDNPRFNIDSLMEDTNVQKALDKAGFTDYDRSDVDADMGSVTIQAIERTVKGIEVKLSRYYQ